MRLQRAAILFLVLGLLVGFEVVALDRFTGEETAAVQPSAQPIAPTAEIQATDIPVPTVIPTQVGFTSPPGPSGNSSSSSSSSSNKSSSSSSNKSSSSSSSKPKATAKPTKKPDPTSVPGTNIGSGSFSSSTGVGMNLNVSWKAQTYNDKARIYITGTVNSYSLSVSGRSVSISYNGYSTSVTGKSINVSGNSQQSNELFSTHLDVPLDTSGTMTVTWKYNGTYHDTDIPEVVASGNVFT